MNVTKKCCYTQTIHRQAKNITDASLTYGSGGGADNFAAWMMTWNYTEIRSYKNCRRVWFSTSTVLREAVQDLGRPWTRMAPYR